MNTQLDPTSRQQLANAANNCLISLADDGVLTILIDTRRNLGPSSSGKTTIIASTGAGEKMNIAGKQATIGLNVYTKLATHLPAQGQGQPPPCLPAPEG